MKQQIVIIGAGGHAKNVVDAVLKQNMYEIVGFCVDNLEKGTNLFNTIPVIDVLFANCKSWSIQPDFIIAIGDNTLREKLYNHYSTFLKAAIVVHPSVSVGIEVNIGDGTVVLAQSVINSNVKIGMNCLINSGVIIDHDSLLGNHVHLKIGSLVASNSNLPHMYCGNGSI